MSPRFAQAIRNAHDLSRSQSVRKNFLELQSWQEVEPLLNAEIKAS